MFLALAMLSSCDHIDAVGDKVNELKDMRKESTQGLDGINVGQILENVKGGPTVRTLTEAEYETFTSQSGRLNIIEFHSGSSRHSVDFEPVLIAAVEAKSSVARLGRVNVDTSPGLAKIQEVRKVPDVRFYLDGQLVHHFTGTESRKTLGKLIEMHSGSIVPADGFTTNLTDGLDGFTGGSSGQDPAKPHPKPKPIDEAMQPMEESWLPPGMSRKK